MLVEVVTVWPGAISALVFVLDAEDQSDVQLLPENKSANGPDRKLCICEAVMFAAAASVGEHPKVVSNAVSTALLAVEPVEK